MIEGGTYSVVGGSVGGTYSVVVVGGSVVVVVGPPAETHAA